MKKFNRIKNIVFSKLIFLLFCFITVLLSFGQSRYLQLIFRADKKIYNTKTKLEIIMYITIYHFKIIAKKLGPYSL